MSPLDRVLALAPTAADRAEIMRIGTELGLSSTSEEWALMLLYAEGRRLFGKRDDDVFLARLEAAVAKAAPAASRPKPTPRAIQRASSAAAWPVIVMVATLAGWLGGTATEHARIHAGPTASVHQNIWLYFFAVVLGVVVAAATVSRTRVQRIR